jgi:hypothetical protein
VIKQIEYRKSKTLRGPEIYRPVADADVGKWQNLLQKSAVTDGCRSAIAISSRAARLVRRIL